MADKILIVDDDPAICKLLEKVMHSNELETTTVNCGMDALSILKNHTFDLILMDIQMPHMNGYQVAEAIRKLLDDRARTPIIAMTANAFEEDHKATLAAGMDAYVAKPIEIDTLFSTITQVLENKITINKS